MEIIKLKTDGSSWINLNPQVDWYYNLEDYENWLMDVSLDFNNSVRGRSGISMRISIMKDDIGPKTRITEYTPKVK